MQIPKGQEEAYRQALEAKLHPAQMRATLGFAGLYGMVHEMIKREVVHKVHEFYWCGFDNGQHRYDEAQYKARVLDRAPKGQTFRASLMWLVESEAITQAQADRLVVIQSHRHDLTHELMKYLIDPDFAPDVPLFTDALGVLRALKRFWIQIEIDTGWIEDATVDEVEPLDLNVLQMAIDAYVEGLADADSPAG